MTTKKEMVIGSNVKINSNDDTKQPMLAFDLIRSILERLSFVDFHRARCVSSDWYSPSKFCMMNPTNPWIIIFLKENHKSSCKLFNPHDKQYYTVEHPGFNFTRSLWLASCGSWLLMLDHRTDFHILHVFTRERISLPSLESTGKKEMICKRTGDYDFLATLKYKETGIYPYRRHNTSIGKAVLWVDEKTKDYLVVWSYDKSCIYQKEEDDHDKNIWKMLQPLKDEGYVDMVLKESKLYVLRQFGGVTVFDFYGGDSPMECASFKSPDSYHYHNDNLAGTLSGEVLFISNVRGHVLKYKWDHELSTWSYIKSIGDEALLLDQGITVAAKDGVVTKNYIYFSDGWYIPSLRCGNYDIQTSGVERVFNENCKDARWFFPTFGAKWLL